MTDDRNAKFNIRKEYLRGLNDTWEVIKKVYLDYSCKTCMDVLGEGVFSHILENLSGAEVVAKVQEYEEQLNDKCSTEQEPCDSIIDYLETCYAGARAMDDAEECVRIARAIEAYNIDPHEDAISRQAMRNEILALWNNNGDKDYYMEVLLNFVLNWPSVIPHSKMQELEQVEIQKAYELGKTLKQEPCDCISRKALIEYANNLKDGIGITANDIARFPSIQPKSKAGHWTPVSEGPPDEEVLVDDGIDRFVAWWVNDGFEKGWHSLDGSYNPDIPILAWMPLPEPYKAESEDKK